MIVVFDLALFEVEAFRFIIAEECLNEIAAAIHPDQVPIRWQGRDQSQGTFKALFPIHHDRTRSPTALFKRLCLESSKPALLNQSADGFAFFV